jgi:glycosyltransferase involved in cell wall biosynthesis
MKRSNGLIIIPAYNEEDNLRYVLSEVAQHNPGLDVLVINDHSHDRTGALGREMGAEVVDLPCNLGYGGAVQAGFRYAREFQYDFCIQLDGDGQHDPSYIPKLVEEITRTEADVVLGSRFLGQASYRIPAIRRLGMRFFGAIVSFATGRKVTDPTTGYQALNARAIRFFAHDNYPADYPDADTLIVLNYAGFNVKEVPVVMRPRVAGTSMHANWKSLYYVVKMSLAIFVVLLRGRKYYGTATPV